MITRPDYLKKVGKFIDVPLVKVFPGVKGCGKTTLLEMIKSELMNKRNIKKENIIFRNYNDIIYEDMTFKEMYVDLIKEFVSNDKYYLFLDELQEINGWEKAINDIFENFNVDIYVAGSDSKLMPDEISSYLSGRYILIPVYTLSFKEYLLFKNKATGDIKDMFNEYLKFGGFPLTGINNFALTSACHAVQGIYSDIIANYISKRHKIRNKDLFDRVVKYVIRNLGEKHFRQFDC